MFTLSDWIVGLWFLPVILCILTPLAMLLGWVVLKFVQSSAEKSKIAVGQNKKSEREDFAEGCQPVATA